MLVKPNFAQNIALLELSKSKQNGKYKSLIVMPSGVGKTHLSAFETLKTDGKILYLAHRAEILIQAKEIFKEVHNLNENDIGFYNAEKKELNKKIIFASVPTISRKKNLYTINKKLFEYLIFDEWHHICAITYQRLLNYFKPKYLLGLTATPFRGDGKDVLSPVKFNIPYQMELKDGISSKLLVPFVYYGLWDDVDYSDIQWRGYKYKKSDLNKKLLIDARDEAIIKEVKEKIGNKRCLGFCVSVKHVNRCVRKFNMAGILSVGVDYTTDYDKRKKIREKFKRNEYQIIFTRDIYNEGIDFPEVEGLLFLRPTFSRRIFFQQLGRGLRKKSGKKNVIVLDFIGNYINAYQIKEWLSEFIKTGKMENIKPEYNHPLAEVYFDRRVIKLFEEKAPPSTEKIIGDYYKLRNKLGRVPKHHEFEWGRRGHCERKWGTWNKFLKSIGETPRLIINKTLDDLIKEYWRLKKLLNKQGPITATEFKKLYREGVAKFTMDAIPKRFNMTYNEFIVSIGEKPYKYDFVTIEMLKKEYQKIKRELDRVPFKREFSLPNVLKKLGFDDWESFVVGMGDNPLKRKCIPESELIQDIQQVWDKLGHQPTRKEYTKLGSFHPETTRRLGGWKKFIKKMGGEDLQFKRGGWNRILKDNIEQDYIRMRKKLGHPVYEDDIQKHGKYSKGVYLRIWGKLSIAQRFLELKHFNNYYHPIKQDCIDVYIAERQKRKKPVPISSIKKINYGIYERYFGNLVNAKKECEREFNNQNKQ